MKSRARRPALWLGGCFVGLCLFCGAGYFLIVSVLGPNADKLEQERETARKLGLPLTAADMVRNTPASENAAPLYQAVFADVKAALNPLKAHKSDLPPHSPEAGELAKFVQRKHLIERIMAATARPHCNFHKDYEQGPALAFPELSSMKDVARVLQYTAERRFADGDYEGGAQVLQAMLRERDHYQEEQLVIHYLLAVSAEMMVHSAIHHSLQGGKVTPQGLAVLTKFYSSLGPQPDLKRAIKGEAVFGQLAIDSIKSTRDISQSTGDWNDGDSSSGFDIPIPGRVRDSWRASHLHYMNALVTELAETNDWNSATAVLEKFDVQIAADNSFSNKINQILFPVFTGLGVAATRLQAMRNLSITEIKLLRMGRNALPTSLDSFGKEADDPFGTRLVYKSLPNGFTLYSVGPNRRDDGGKKGKTDFDDILVSVDWAK